MPSSRSFTLYKIRQQIGRKPVASFEDPLSEDVLARSTLSSYELIDGQDFEAKLFVDSPEATEPGWLEFLEEGFGDIPVERSVANSAVLVIRLRSRAGADEYFAFTYGFGRFLLRHNAYERSYGLRVALNALYQDDNPAALDAPVRVRRVDAKTVAANTMLSRRQTNRLASFDEFGLDVQRDLLGAVTGVPKYTDQWGSRIGGADALYLNLALEFSQLGRLCRRILDAYERTDYQVRFSWVDHIHTVTDPNRIAELESLAVGTLRGDQPGRFELAPPELIEWDEVTSFGFSFEPEVRYPELDLKDYLAALARARQELDIEKLQTHRVEVFNGAEMIYRWPVFQCLDGEIRPDGHSVYLLVGGDFFEVAPSYLNELDGYIQQLQEWQIKLPDSKPDEREGPYNERAAASAGSLMLDRQLVRIDTTTDAIEICDILTRQGCLVHVKRKLSSSSLSHLFAQGAVSGDLLLMSSEFRQKAIEVIQEAARAMNVDPAPFLTFGLDGITAGDHEIVYGIIAEWGSRPLVEGLPFFSKVNLRRHTEELKRMGYRISYRRIDMPRQARKKAKSAAQGRRRSRTSPASAIPTPAAPA